MKRKNGVLFFVRLSMYCGGYVYIDLKLNYVFLEKCGDELFYFVIIDFGKSVLLIEVKNFFIKLMYVRG